MGRMALVLDNAIASSRALKDVEEGRGNSPGSISLAVHRDAVSAVLFGTRSALAFLAMACLWLATAWPAATSGMLLTCVVCGLFASKENGAQIGMSFLRGIALAVPTALLSDSLFCRNGVVSPCSVWHWAYRYSSVHWVWRS